MGDAYIDWSGGIIPKPSRRANSAAPEALVGRGLLGPELSPDTNACLKLDQLALVHTNVDTCGLLGAVGQEQPLLEQCLSNPVDRELQVKGRDSFHFGTVPLGHG